jgi:hypothetical protein
MAGAAAFSQNNSAIFSCAPLFLGDYSRRRQARVAHVVQVLKEIYHGDLK